jgi:hypothetical protein
MPATYADGVITGRLVGSAIAYLLLGTSFVFEFLDMKNTKLVKSRNDVNNFVSANTGAITTFLKHLFFFFVHGIR